MAAPVLDRAGQAWAGLAIQGPAERLADDRLDALAARLLAATSAMWSDLARIGARSVGSAAGQAAAAATNSGSRTASGAPGSSRLSAAINAASTARIANSRP